MKALSVRQPWAWLIVNGCKDIENRNWYTTQRGRIWIHAAKKCTRYEYDEACRFAKTVDPKLIIPDLGSLPRGGIVGSVKILDCVDYSDSPWFVGDYGFLLNNAQSCSFIPYRGQLGFFEVEATP